MKKQINKIEKIMISMIINSYTEAILAKGEKSKINEMRKIESMLLVVACFWVLCVAGC